MFVRLFLILASVLLGALLPLEQPVYGQATGTPAFSTIELQAGASANVNRNGFHRYWSPSPGLEAQLRTPFYLGTVEAGLAYHGYAQADAGVPDFKAVQGHLGWGLPIHILSRVTLYNGLRLGNYYMIFGDAVTTGTVGCDRDNPKGCGDDPSAVGGKTESEFFLGLHHRVAVRVGETWAVALGGSFLNVFTHTPIRLWHVTAGVSTTLRTPRWLRTLLQ